MSILLRIEDIVDKHNNNLPFSGALLARNNEEIIAHGYGYANRSEQIENNEHTRFGIASGCKIFTAVAICQLVQRGDLSFDSLLKDCLDFSFPNFDPSITVHHLLTHSSGIPDYFDEEIMDDFEALWMSLPMYSIRGPKDFLPMFQNENMKFSPGERFSYSNAGYILLGLIIEQISGMEFTAYVEENIFQRSGMIDSGYFSLDHLPERTAIGYIDHDQGWKTNVYSIPIKGGPDGGAFTTVYDLEKFWHALFSYQLLSQEFTTILLTPHISEDEYSHYGYGVWILIINKKIFKYYVMGGDPGVTMQSSLYADRKLQVHIIGNINVGAGMLASAIDDMIWKGG